MLVFALETAERRQFREKWGKQGRIREGPRAGKGNKWQRREDGKSREGVRSVEERIVA